MTPMGRKGIQRLSPERKARIWRYLLKEYGPICQWCFQRIDMTIADPYDDKHRSIDHIIPWSKGGTNDLSNLRPMHKICNNERATE